MNLLFYKIWHVFDVFNECWICGLRLVIIKTVGGLAYFCSYGSVHILIYHHQQNLNIVKHTGTNTYPKKV